ncbi:MAG: hypothetical protein R3C53_14715 [Pirellulaceae bacterium]
MADHWKSIANLLGTPGIDEPESEDTAPEAQSSATEAPHADTESPAVMDESQQEVTSVTPKPWAEEAPPTAPASAEESAPTKKKRRSSWEALASMFNISAASEPEPANPTDTVPTDSKVVGASEETAAARATDAPRAQPSARRETEPELSIFGAESDRDDNPALDSLFPAAKRDSKSKADAWAKPKRVVDDVSWDADDDYPTEPNRVVDEVSDDLDEAADTDSVEAATDGEGQRRGRRRRRRGRRSGKARDGETLASSDSTADDSPIAKSAASWKEAAAWDDDLDVDVEPGDEWPEPESFAEELDSPPAEAVSEDMEEGEVLRRSNRRRRGRSRGRDRETPIDRDSAPQPGRPTRAQPVSRGRDIDETEDELSEDLVDEAPAPTSRRSPDDLDEPARGKRSRRRRPRRGESDERPRRDSELAKLDDRIDNDGDRDTEDREDTVEKHRNIPTWNDALEPIVLANTENHKRNEGRGGSRGGGRSRGRR